MKKYIYFLLFSLCFISSKESKANIILNKMILDFLPNSPRQENVEIYNDDEENVAYISSDILEVQNPGMADEKRVAISQDSKNRLVVAPSKLVINPLMKKRFQFIVTDSNLKEDKIYRIAIVPKIAGVKKGLGNIGIKILIGYDVLVIVRPQKMNFDLKVVKGKDSITFINQGNTNILLENVKQCLKPDDCKLVLSDRLYAGNKITKKLIYKNKPVIAEMYYADKFKKETY